MKTKLLKKARGEYSIYKGIGFVCEQDTFLRYEYYEVRFNGKKINSYDIEHKNFALDYILGHLRKRFPNLGKRRIINGTVKIWP